MPSSMRMVAIGLLMPVASFLCFYYFRSMMDDKPKKPVVIQSIRVDTKGVDYPEPETR